MRWLALALLVTTVGCGASTSTPQPLEIAPSRQSDVLGRQEIEGTVGLSTALDAIQRLRPRFFRNSGPRSMRAADTGPVVRMDNEFIGGVETLRTIPASDIEEIRFFSAVDATARFGGATGRPVILIVRKGGARG